LFFTIFSRQFLLDKRREYGNIFATSIDFSGTFLVSRKVVCLFNTTATEHAHPSLHPTNRNQHFNNAFHTTLNNSNPNHHNNHHTPHAAEYVPYRTTPTNLKYVAYSGLFGASSPVRGSVPVLAERVLNNYEYLDRWEDVATPIIRTFLRRLVYEGSFSFADRVNE
jgi:hypothetical protein